MRRLESLASWLILIGILTGAWYMYPTEIRSTALTVVHKIAPCSIPISYRVGSIDPKFGISEKTVRDDLARAAALWNAAAKKDIFVFDQEHGLVDVRLAYDSRQEMTVRLKGLGVQVTNDRASYDRVKELYDTAFVNFSTQKKNFDLHVADFNAEKNAYEKEVAYWNTRGGAPRSEFQKLEAQKQKLTIASHNLETEQLALNSNARDVNDLAATLNKLIESLKLDVNKYNETGQSHGESFEQGVYERDFGKQTITIFEYENNALLTRVLAHELGHAIGLEHVDNPAAIMHYLNQGSSIELTSDDIAALSAQCVSPIDRLFAKK